MSLLLGACYSPVKTPAPAESITVRAIYQSVLCGGRQPQPRLNWITAQDRYRDVYVQIAHGSAVTGHVEPPEIDFSMETVLVISMGQRPTGGYRLWLSGGYLYVRDDELTVPVMWSVPAADEYVAQMITHPCLILALPRTDARSITVRDQADNIVLRSSFR